MRTQSLDAELLLRIPLSARSVLDVGCGNGNLGKAFRALNPNARLLGIERDPGDAARARAHLDQVVLADVEADPLPFDVPEGLDCVVYAAVLEHLADPWAVVRRHAAALSRDGVMLLCLPNPDHWQMAERTLRGAPDPNEPSVSFGATATQRQLRRAGLFVTDMREWAGPGREGAAYFIEALTPALHALGIDAGDFAARATPSHVIWRATRQQRQPTIVSGTMLDPVGGVSHVRVVHPFRALSTDPDVRTHVTNEVDSHLPTDGIPRIFVLHRPALIGPQGRELLRKVTSAGFVVVTEFDDHPDHFQMMQLGGELSFRGVHAVQTSTAALAEVLRKYNPEIAVFPNAIAALPPVRNFADAPRRMTLFFGALNREVDWRPLMPVVNEVIRLAGDRIGFQVVHDQGFFDALDTRHKAFTPTCDYETYLRILGGCEICFMPLADTKFNRSKSDLKFIEAGACRVAAVGSTVVYGDSIHHGRNGLLFRDGEELRHALLRLLAMPEDAMRLADAARRYVAAERMLAYQVAPRLAWYRSLWHRRETLNTLLNQRLARVA